ncbi:MAG: hypothetical protein Fues2KO_02820 [Fuerstiella sp.]
MAEHTKASVEVFSEPEDRSPSAVVGIGASAGGLEALESLFDALPSSTGMAFVVVQHLSPDFKSHMEELLSRHTSMAIHRVEHEMPVEANSIYLIPPKKDMVIDSGRLLLLEKSSDQKISHPINRFFHSLAKDCGSSAIGIVLSGTGSDGARGVTAIHEAEGLVIVQSVESAKFDGMPMNAISTGIADLVLTPEAIGHALKRLAEEGITAEVVTELQNEWLEGDGTEQIFQLLREQHGLDFSLYKSATIARRIQRRIDLLNLPSQAEYIQLLIEDPGELNQLYKDLLIGVTRFFRDAEAFDVLERDIIPSIFRRRDPDTPIRVWVAGCASGEEAYSLAILIDEEIRRRKARFDVKIFATDVHHVSLHTAARGVFPEESLSELSETRRNEYFQKRSGGYQIAPHIRRHVIFAPHNVIADAPFTQMDLVSCRNMLIYLQPSAQRKVMSLFHFALKADGVLFLGPSETPGEISDEFTPLNSRWRIYRKNRDVRLPLVPPVRVSRHTEQPTPVATAPIAGKRLPVSGALLGTYDLLLERRMPPSILASNDLEILHVFAGAEAYIQSRSGRRTNLLMDLIEPALKTPLTGAVQHALRKGDVVRYLAAHRAADGKLEDLQITVEPIHDPRTRVTNLLIEFGVSPGKASREITAEQVNAGEISRERIAGLESDLRFSEENLQATIEEMETSNEELQATNEELVASNEELQSTNEELHSVNEELYTVNQEHQRRVEELAQANTDMDNLLATTRVGVVYLDEDFCIRRFTPEIGRLLHLMPHDVGRSIEGFNHHLLHGDLIADLKTVFEEQREVERDLDARDGTSYLLRMLPYRSNDRVSGVVMTLIDVSRLRQTQREVERFKFMSEAAVDMQVLVDSDGRFAYANAAFCDAVGYTADELLQMTVPDVDTHFDAKRYQELFDALEEQQHAGLESELKHREGQQLPVEVAISPVVFDGQKFAFAALRDISGRRAAEQEARLLHAAVDSAGSGLLITDYLQPDNPITYVNSGFCEMTGYSEEDSLGRNCRFLQGDGTDPETVTELREAIAEGRNCRVLLKNYKRDGTPFWNDLVVTPVHSSDGQVTHFIGIQNDVTDRVEYMSRMQAILDTTAEGIYGVDIDGNCVFCNQAALDLLGYEDEEELLGRHMHSIMHHHHGDGSDYDATECPVYRAFTETQPVHIDDEVFWRKDGSSFDAEYWSRPMTLEGVVVGAVVTFLDISARRRTDERVDRLGRMVDASHDAIIVRSEDGVIQSWNLGAIELYGFTSEEAVGKTIHELLQTRHPTSYDDVRQSLQYKGEWSGIVRHITKLGEERLVSTRQQLWKGRGRQPLVFEINRDVTVEQQIRHELQEANVAAEQASTAKSEFLASVSHELRTPMTAVLGFADMLEAELTDDSMLEKVRTISRNGEYLLALLNDILDLSKIEAGKMDIHSEAVDVMQVVEDVRSLMAARAKDEGIPLYFEYRGEIPARVTGDKVRIRQILVNLVANALKFTDEGEVRVVVSMDQGDGNASFCIDVRDTGIGMTEEQQRNLFVPFTQATRETARKFGGTGLGLSISKRLADAMHGNIQVRSVKGKGSTFRLVLPITSRELEELISPDNTMVVPDKHRVATDGESGLPRLDARILLADDRRDVWRVVKYFLDRQGAQVTVAEDGRQAVDEANRARHGGQPFDLILMDMQMPVMNGREAVTTLREQGFEVPIVALTADAMSGERETCISFGCTEYFPKPVDGPALVRLIAGLLEE